MAAFLTNWRWALFLLSVVGIMAIIWRLRRAPKTPKSDIQRKELESDLQWQTSADDSLKKVYAYVVDVSDRTIQWYEKQRGPKRKLGFSLRLGALVLTVAAGLVPLSKIPPVWSTVMLALAGLFVSIDLLAGHTSGWVRYMLAQQKVERVKDAFLIEWNALKVAKTDVQGMLERAKAFLLAVGKIVDERHRSGQRNFRMR